jgi:hypothetical protein
MCWTIFPSIGNRKSTTAKASNWIARHWPIGSAVPAIRRSLFWMCFEDMCWREPSCTATTFRFPFWFQVTGKPNGRLWTYVRDERPAGSNEAAAVWFASSPDRKSENPFTHLGSYRGTLQADGYAGFNRLYEKGEIVACWAHVRRKFCDLFEAHASPIAKEALENG